MKYYTTIGDNEFAIEIIDDKHINIDGEIHQIDFSSIDDQPVQSLLINGESYEAYVYAEDNLWQVLLKGTQYQAKVEDEREKLLREASPASGTQQMEFHLKAPMPGLIIDTPVEDGQQVEKGDVLIILESMKMQNELKSPRAGTIARIRVKPGDNVEQLEIMLSVV